MGQSCSALGLKPREPDRHQTSSTAVTEVSAPDWYIFIAMQGPLSSRAREFSDLPAQTAPELKERVTKSRHQCYSADFLAILTEIFPPKPSSSSRLADSKETDWPRQHPQHMLIHAALLEK